MNAVTARKMSQRRAKACLAEMRTNFLRIEELLIEFIKGEGWLALGYASFDECWRAELAGIRLATDSLRAHVAYAMFDHGATPADVVRATGSRIGDQAALALQRQHGNKVPAERASTRVREHDRVLPSGPMTFHIKFESDEYERIRGIYEARGIDFEDRIRGLIRKDAEAVERRKR